MKKSTKVLLGIATIWPAVYMFLFMASILLMIAWAGYNSSPPGSAPHLPPGGMLFPIGFMGVVFVHSFTILGSVGLTVFYIVRVFKTERIDQNLKITWTLLMFFFGMFAQPVFWYFYIWREPELCAPACPPLLARGFRMPWTKEANRSEREAAYVPPAQPPDWR